MGTNYYLYLKSKYTLNTEKTQYGMCEEIYNVSKISNGYVWNNKYYKTLKELNNDFFIPYHIGKDSYGWYFLLATYPSINVNSLDDWKKLLTKPSAVIKNEYNQKLTIDELLSFIDNKTHPLWDWNDEKLLYSSMTKEDFKAYATIQRAVPGIRGLLRRMEDGKYITNSEGTFDYFNSDDLEFC